MNKKDNTELMLDKMVLVANLYYRSKLSQQDIAQKLNISRPWVSKLLSRAEELPPNERGRGTWDCPD